MSPIVIGLLAIASVFTALISAVIGMSGGIVLLSIMTFFLDIKQIVPIHGVVQLVSNGTRVLSLIKNVNTKIFLPSLDNDW